jgi:hypothetical protein
MKAETPLQKLIRLCDNSPTAAARRLGVSRQTIYDWQRGEIGLRNELAIEAALTTIQSERKPNGQSR